MSEKYILACDSMALFIEPKYYDFFSRSLVPLRHYWPISIQNMCQDINFAVEWGNSNAQKVHFSPSKNILLTRFVNMVI